MFSLLREHGLCLGDMITNTKNLFQLSFLVAVLIMLAIGTFSTNAAQPASTWVSYTDPRFDYSLKYPADWILTPRDDSDPTAFSTVLSFTPALSGDDTLKSHRRSPAHIFIGLYLAEIEPAQSLSEWTDAYEEASKSFDAGLVSRKQNYQSINGVEVIRASGTSPLTDYQFVNLVHGRTVWFIWTNIGDSEDSPASDVFESLVNSFHFGPNTPTSLQEVYGDNFRPLKLGDQPTGNVYDPPGMYSKSTAWLKTGLPDWVLPSSWKSPVVGNYIVRCGSPAHVGAAQWAADAGTPSWTYLYVSYSGNVIFAGWNTQGYGNLIKISTVSSQIQYYGHLAQINTYVGANVVTYQFIGRTGNTGQTTGPHLHFHVDWTNLTGMSGFTPWANWPGTPNINEDCGRMGR
jgi:hypothetical protein